MIDLCIIYIIHLTASRAFGKASAKDKTLRPSGREDEPACDLEGGVASRLLTTRRSEAVHRLSPQYQTFVVSAGCR